MASGRFHVVIFFLSFGGVLLCSAKDAITFTLVPDSISFSTNDVMHSSEVADVFSTMLSYTLTKPSTWQSLDSVNPLKSPECIYVLDVMGVSPDLQLNIPGNEFILENMGDLDQQFTMLALRTKERFGQNSEGQPVLIQMNADDELYGPKSENQVLFKTIPADSEGRLEKAKEDTDLGRTLREGTFNMSLLQDSQFLLELETVKLLNKGLLLNKDRVRDGIPDIYWINMKGLHGMVDEYGADSNQAKEAARLCEQICREIQTTIQNVYKDRGVVAVITETAMPYQLGRNSRSLLQEKPTVTEGAGEVKIMGNYSAYEFQDDFHVAFALTAFTSVILILTVLGVSVGMWFMDPGRDSIIYRMTSQRKKD